MGSLGSIVEPTAGRLVRLVADLLHRSTAGAMTVRCDCLWLAATLQRALQKRMRSLAIPAFGGKHFQHLAFVIDRAPEIVRFTVDLNEHLVHVSSPLRT